MVVSTNKARCRDCYRCVRTCPVKAVRVQKAQAEVVAEYCIACASCVRACPQRAKQIRDDLPAAKALVASGSKVIASVAPSAPAFFPVKEFAQLRSALKRLGFADAAETALGAELVAAEYRRLWETGALVPAPMIATACPTAVFLVEKYYPDLVPHLAPVVSPMVAHARYLKAAYGEDVRVVFIGPCVAKKKEAEDAPVEGAVDLALTFDELGRWLVEEGVEVGPPAGVARAGGHPARLFPVEGGMLRTAALDTDVLSPETLVMSGLARCRTLLDAVRGGEVKAHLVEVLACPGGCIYGPAMLSEGSIYARRQQVISFAREREEPDPRALAVDLRRDFGGKYVPRPTVSEEDIRAMLARTEKYRPEDELNCRACGYSSCREKAEATCLGMAEVGMCVPYMRRRAESLANVVIDAAPNAIVVLDQALRIQDLSRRAEGMLRCRKADVVGRPLAEFIPAATFEEVRDTGRSVLGRRVRYRDDLVVAESVVPAEGTNLIVGIIQDVTYEEEQAAELKRLRESAIAQAQEVIHKQMRVAHEIASLLGETTAETKVQLSRLICLMQEDGGGAGR